MNEMTTTFVATQEYIQSQLKDKVDEVIRLEKALEAARDINRSNASTINRITDRMQEWTVKEFGDGGITEEQAQEIANLVGFDLTKEVEAEVTVTYNITLQVPAGENAEDIINDIDFEAISYDTDTITWLSADVGQPSIS